MIWYPAKREVYLTHEDLKIVTQCNMSFEEIIHPDQKNEHIPPLWSVLSYVLLQQNCCAEMTWCHFRKLKEMAQHTQNHYYRCQIPKSNGEARILEIPDPDLRYQQRYIMDTILSALPVDTHAYAYRKGFSIQDCAAPHVNRDVLIHLDLKNFFGSITEDMVYETFLRETGYSKSLCRFLAQMCCLRRRLPQGTVTSPMLSNVVFRPCDEALAEIAQRQGLHYSRYSDDLYFSGDHKTDVNALIQEVAKTLLAKGFQLNSKKTTVRRAQHRQSVLGLTVNDHLQVSREYRRRLLQELHYLERFGPDCNGAKETGDYLSYMQQLQGKLAYVLRTDPGDPKLLTAQSKLLYRISQYTFLQDREILF